MSDDEKTDFERDLVKIFCHLYEAYEEHTKSVIVDPKTVKMYERLKKLRDEG